MIKSRLFKVFSLGAVLLSIAGAFNVMSSPTKAYTYPEALQYLGVLKQKDHLDYDDPELEIIFSSDFAQDKYLLKLLSAFIRWDKDRKDEAAIQNARQVFKEGYQLIHDNSHSYYTLQNSPTYQQDQAEAQIEAEFFQLLTDEALTSYVTDKEIHGHLPKNTQRPYYRIPLWLVSKYPQILSHDEGRFPHYIAIDNQPDENRSFSSIEGAMARMTEGFWTETSYYPWAGTLRHDLRGGYFCTYRETLVAPEVIVNPDLSRWGHIEDPLAPLKSWATQGLWNSICYQDFVPRFEEAVKILENFYQTNTYEVWDLNRKNRVSIQTYVPWARYILSMYVHNHISDPSDTPAYHLVESFDEATHGKILKLTLDQNLAPLQGQFDTNNIHNDEVRAYWTKFSQFLQEAMTEEKTFAQLKTQMWNEFLSRAILKGFSADTIELIIKIGADINAPNHFETPLMNAANKPEIMKLLIKHGADVNASNPFGKSALFYAIQFGDYECVKTLVDQGANVNKTLHSLEEFEKLYDNSINRGMFMLESVANFTPLIYAMRYANQDVQDLLKQKGAIMGTAPQERVGKWVEEGKERL